MRTCTATCCPSADGFLVNSDEASLSKNTVLLIGTRTRDHTNKVAILATPHWPPVQFSLFTCKFLNDQTHLYLKDNISSLLVSPEVYGVLTSALKFLSCVIGSQLGFGPQTIYLFLHFSLNLFF